ncbi:MAG: hypothetical protein ACON4K_06535 [Akkermansiaceae bacterium]
MKNILSVSVTLFFLSSGASLLSAAVLIIDSEEELPRMKTTYLVEHTREVINPPITRLLLRSLIDPEYARESKDPLASLAAPRGTLEILGIKSPRFLSPHWVFTSDPNPEEAEKPQIRSIFPDLPHPSLNPRRY